MVWSLTKDHRVKIGKTKPRGGSQAMTLDYDVYRESRLSTLETLAGRSKLTWQTLTRLG